MNIKELKENLHSKSDMTRIYAKIKSHAEDGERLVRFSHRGCAEEDEITEAQVDILYNQGYTVEWNRPCLWYEVSGWK